MRYVVKSRKLVACDEYDPPLVLNHLSVDDTYYSPTGILTSDGEMIYRAPPPIGFGRDSEW